MRRVLGIALALGAMLLLPWPARAESHDVDVQDDAYSPAQTTVALGDDVTWTVSSSGYHTVTFDNGVHSSDNCLPLTGTNCMGHGAKFTVTFDTAGLFSYHCEVHAGMTGTVFVESGVSSSTTSSTASTSSTVTTTTLTTTTSASSSSLSQAPPPKFTSTTRVALPRAVTVRTETADDVTPWVLADVAISGATVIIGAALVRKGRVPFG